MALPPCGTSSNITFYDQYDLFVFEHPNFLKNFPEYVVLDQEGYSDPQTHLFIKKNYRLAAAFKPFSLGPFSMDSNYYINTAIRIFTLKSTEAAKPRQEKSSRWKIRA